MIRYVVFSSACNSIFIKRFFFSHLIWFIWMNQAPCTVHTYMHLVYLYCNPLQSNRADLIVSESEMRDIFKWCLWYGRVVEPYAHGSIVYRFWPLYKCARTVFNWIFMCEFGIDNILNYKYYFGWKTRRKARI